MTSANETLAKVIQELDGQNFADALMAWVSDLVPHDNIALLAYYQDRRPDLIFSDSNTPEVHADLGKGYIEGAYLLDPFFELHISRSPSGVYRLSDVAPDQFARTKYFIEYYRETTMVDEIVFVCYPNPGVSLQLCLGRDQESNKRFSRSDLRKARESSPIVVSLLARQWSDLNTTGSLRESDTIERISELAHAIHEVHLTPRQAQIILLILKGHSSTSIGLKLDIAYETVKVFRRQIYKKCNISSQAELFSLFLPLLYQLGEV